MLCNVTKSADVLRGPTEMQEVWMEVEKETYVPGRPPPPQAQSTAIVARIMSEKERRDELERIAHVRQQKINFYESPSVKKLKQRKSDMPKSERKKITERLTARPTHSPPRPKSPTNRGHVLATGELSPRLESPKGSPKSRAPVSPPGTIVQSSRRRDTPKTEGLTAKDFYRPDAKESFTYRPAKQDKPWQNLEGFAQSTRTLERRKMDPYLDINSFQGNLHSSKEQFNAHGFVRPLDVKGNLGALPVQQWKETLREDFARDEDNASTNAHDADLDMLRTLLAQKPIYTDIE